MEQAHISIISAELNIKANQVAAVMKLLGEGATVPFIARYRKEVTGSLDEVAITGIRDRQKQLIDLDSRRETILESIDSQGKLTDDLRRKIMDADSLSRLEDIYLPYRPKRRTRAIIATEKGLEPLARMLMSQGNGDPLNMANRFVDAKKEVNSEEEALAGARDIIAEWVNEREAARNRVRKLFQKEGVVKTKLVKGKEEEGKKFRDYFEFEEKLSRAPSHRMLAMRRAESEKIIRMSIAPPVERAAQTLERIFLKAHNPCADEVEKAVMDGYKRLLAPSIETETRLEAKQRADAEAIEVFAENLRQLLLAAPLGQKNVMAIDPGFRTGCKVACLNRQGKLLEYDAIFPHTGQGRATEAAAAVKNMVRKHNIEAIAIGNGTAGRETEAFIQGLNLDSSIMVVMVNESGASIYSASEVAREEFPDLDLTVRGAVSIGRRLMDPLAELVKIDPKSIGVGQYQHDVDQNKLKAALDDVVESCVNKVGVEVNTASKQLLTYVSGLGPSLAENIVKFRDENGPFKSRKDLKKVPRLGDKAFEQSAGFLRIAEAKNPLDSSAVHPESYKIVDQMAKDLGVKVGDLIRDEELRKKIELRKYVTAEVGMPTLKDILSELARPGRDPREQFEVFSFAEGIDKMEDLHLGMVLPGIVTNITRFGAFVDVGVHQDGLVHVSEMADRYVSDPGQVVKLNQKVMVKVKEVDLDRKRIAFSMKGVGNK